VYAEMTCSLQHTISYRLLEDRGRTPHSQALASAINFSSHTIHVFGR
jgi:hypothetical protein